MGTTNSLSNAERYVAIHDSERFNTLRRRWHTFTLVASVIFAGWWLLTTALGALAPAFYRVQVAGGLNVGILFVLVTFALVLVISAIYLKYARTQLDPLGEEIRADLEGDPR